MQHSSQWLKSNEKIEELTTSKNLVNKMTGEPQNPDNNGNKLGEKPTRKGKKKKWCNNCKSWVYHSSDKYHTEKIDRTVHHGTTI